MADGNAAAPARFGHGGAFRSALKEASDAYFATAAWPRRDIPAMYLKTAIILTWFVGSWVLLVFYATRAWQGVALAMSLGLSVAAIGMSVQHDANHGGYSRHAWVNRAMGFTLDVMGVCGWFWRQKHNVIHHTYTNVRGVDFDLDFGDIARLSPDQPLRPWQRYQQYYLWVLYCFLLPKWVFHDDFVLLRTRRAGLHSLPPMGRGEVALFYGWKVFFVGWSLVIPSLYHPVWQVLLFHLLAASTLGLTLSSVFQLAHCVDAAEFPEVPHDGAVVNTDWGMYVGHARRGLVASAPAPTGYGLMRPCRGLIYLVFCGCWRAGIAGRVETARARRRFGPDGLRASVSPTPSCSSPDRGAEKIAGGRWRGRDKPPARVHPTYIPPIPPSPASGASTASRCARTSRK
jgi:linoleoyl-CoA desaturase